MKIDRLIGILSILLQKETITAPALAEQFEVSRRTISRDIDTLVSGRHSHRYKTGNKRRDLHYGRLHNRPHSPDRFVNERY